MKSRLALLFAAFLALTPALAQTPATSSYLQSAINNVPWTNGTRVLSGGMLQNIFQIMANIVASFQTNYVTASTFGADPTGVADSTAAFNAAIASLPNGGKVHYCGKYLISGTIAVNTSGVQLEGCSATGAVLLQNAPSGNTVVIGNSNICCNVQKSGITDTTIQPAPGITRTGGAAIQCLGDFKCDVRNNDLESQYIGLDIYANGNSAIEYNYIHNTLACGNNAPSASNLPTGGPTIAIWDHGSSTAPTGQSVANYIHRNFISSASAPCFGMLFTGNVQGERVSANETQNAYKNGYVTTASFNGDPTGSVIQMFFDHNDWDVTATTSGTPGTCPAAESTNATFTLSTDAPNQLIRDFNTDHEWYSGSSCGDGFAANAVNGPMDTIFLSGSQFRNNHQTGIRFAGTPAQIIGDVTITGDKVYANSYLNNNTFNGIFLYYVQQVTVTGGFSGAGAGFGGTQAYGAYLGTGTDYVSFNGVNVTGNASGGINYGASTGTHNVVVNNPGQNPSGVVIPTVGPSPWAYTAGPQPTTLYLNGGTCSSIATAPAGATTGGPIGSNCSTGAYQLGPNEVLIATYSVAPTAAASVH